MLTISDIKKTKNSVNPMNRFRQLQRAGQSYRPGGRRQEFATKLAFGAKLAENTKLTETPLCQLWLFLNSLIRSIRAIRGSNPVILSNSFESLCLCGYLNSASSAFSAVNEIFFVPISHLYICWEPSTNQLLFMQNKPNLLDAQMNLSNVKTMNYKNFIPLVAS